MPEHPIDVGRLNIVRAFLSNHPGLNVGCACTHFPNKINIDIERNSKTEPSILGSVLTLPIKSAYFKELVFTEVMEHISVGCEVKALHELSRVLVPGGLLIMSVPNNTYISKILDPFFWAHGHRHYSVKQIRNFFSQTDLKIIRIFSSGSIPFGVITLAYALNWILARQKKDLCKKLVLRAYVGSLGFMGGTLFIIASKYIQDDPKC